MCKKKKYTDQKNRELKYRRFSTRRDVPLKNWIQLLCKNIIIKNLDKKMVSDKNE